MRSLSFARFVSIPFCLFILVSSAWGQSDSTLSDFETPIFVGHLDFDCVEDTLIGLARAPDFRVLPDRIHWGMDSTLNCGTLTSHEEITYLVYPDWDSLSGSVTLSTSRRDTAMSLTIFGQDGIADLDSLSLSLSDTLQESPFFAMQLIRESRFTDSAIDNYSGYASYEMPVVLLDVNQDTTSAPPPVIFLSSIESSSREEKLKTEIWPNPTSQQTTIRLRPLSPGMECQVELISADGTPVMQENLTVNASGELLRVIDLSTFSSGYYQIIVRSGNEILTSRSLAVIK